MYKGNKKITIKTVDSDVFTSCFLSAFSLLKKQLTFHCIVGILFSKGMKFSLGFMSKPLKG